MRLKCILVIILLSLFATSYSQKSIPTTIVSTSIGVGSNYGGIGSKTIIGYKNSGLLVGVGHYTIGIAYEIGIQYSYRWLYINAGYAPFGVAGKEDGNHKNIYGKNITSGVMISLGKRKRTFIDLGYGYCWDGKLTGNNGEEIIVDGFMAVLGIGYRWLSPL